nr:MAG TPA: hypothetical protein [Caudoviricetes sp.]
MNYQKSTNGWFSHTPDIYQMVIVRCVCNGKSLTAGTALRHAG